MKKILCLTTISFDIFFLESILALCNGLKVILATEKEQDNPKNIVRLITDNGVDMIQMTPSRMQQLWNYDKKLDCLKNVKEIMIGGEPFPENLLKTLQAKTTAKIFNMYGPTETTIWSTVSDLTYKEHVNIGYPIKNAEVFIVDDCFNILPPNQVGEICIAGKCLSKGYVKQDDLTAVKFIHLPHKPNIKVFRTGDLGRYDAEGSLVYLGRIDNQVKIRGYRIELEEIESHLNQFKGVRQSVVVPLETSETDKILQAFYTSHDTIHTKDILDYLSTKLPSYMIPVRFKRVKEFIQSGNGKIDRKRILDCIEIKSEEDKPTTCLGELNFTQKRAYRIIYEIISEKCIENISIDMDFINAGFDSITFIKMIVTLENEFNFEFDDDMLLVTNYSTIKDMVEYVELKTL